MAILALITPGVFHIIHKNPQQFLSKTLREFIHGSFTNLTLQKRFTFLFGHLMDVEQ
jgi:hypothetical protein